MYCIITIVALDYTHYKQRAVVFLLDTYKHAWLVVTDTHDT
jgi:hypothetical protein